MSDSSVKAGSTFSFKEKLSYTCDKDALSLNCAVEGEAFDVSCPSKMNFIS